MMLFLAAILLVSDMVVASPQQCYHCVEDDCETRSLWTNQTCAGTSRYSLGTTHCGTAAIRYTESYLGLPLETIFRGCFDCMDEGATCLALGGLLKSSRGWILLQCDIACCNETNCNTYSTQLTQNATTVFQPNVPGPASCHACNQNDANSCTLNQESQSCRGSAGSLGTTHCSSAKVKTRDLITGLENITFLSGCIDCEDKKAACAILAGSLRFRESKKLLECDIECCNGSYCNDRAANLTKCWHCMEGDGSTCSIRQKSQICSLDPNSLGTTHCGSAVGRRHNQHGIVENYFYRGCFDCAKKRETCFALGGYLKGDVDNVGATTVLECDVKCCDNSVINGSYCNVHTPKLLPAAVTVFTPTVTGPAQCNACLEDDTTSCSNNQQIQACATDPYSLGTTHCGSAIGRYRNSKGNIVYGFFRGCINCADKKAACAALGGFRKNVQKWTQMECEIECCTEDNCNTQIPSLVKVAQPNAAPCKDMQQFLKNVVLAFLIAFVSIVY